jgi:hypothetical protein
MVIEVAELAFRPTPERPFLDFPTDCFGSDAILGSGQKQPFRLSKPTTP